MITSFSKRTAFTLIEMLVVIVIMSLLAVALVSALRSAQRQAQATLCQARMKNLHQACMNYLSDNEQYPYAGSHEWQYPYDQLYYEHKGWVGWIRKDGRDDYDPWLADDREDTHADEYLHVGWSGEQATRAIKQGSIFKYCTGDTSTFFCKQFKGTDVRRSYAMNVWFGARRVHHNLWRGRKLHDFQTAGLEPSRMGYIIELANAKVSGEIPGEEAGQNVGKRKALPDDPVWEYGDGELFGRYHRKAGQMHGHVIFVDGHIESLSGETNAQGDDHATQSTKIGNATN